ncbi:hypothetical protein BDP81DRAFT_400741 [Colletotrichum phormii]|uniref:Uncharacterized protein n=1 Tax=Colletotrichum phormii TaxID=359342 RepID=A0AAJ0E7U9_9PEZI|nr:uncharacterized protein BDP81DRAFT_400741 [Colletotrichum phormii]KAK1621961.1 hypothetical protein BDP81DRAFT_400741 [Colletotrichum phormii]
MANEAIGPAEYALIQELFINPKIYLPTHPKNIAERLQESPHVKYTQHLDETPELPFFAVPEPIFTPEIDLQDESADDMLAKSIQVFPPEDIFKLSMEASIPHTRFSHAILKLELPSLRSDPRHDFKALGRLESETKCLDFFRKPNTLPHEPVNDAKDEGLGLPLSAIHFHGQLARGAEPDELDYTEEDLAYVAESTYVEWSEKDFEQLFALETGMMAKRVEAMTPPLIMTPFDATDNAELFIPDADFCEIHQFSDPERILEEDIEFSQHILDEAYEDFEFLDASTSDIVGIPSDTPSFDIPTPPPRKITAPAMEAPILPKSDDSIPRSEGEEAFRAIMRDTAEFTLRNVPGPSRSSPCSEEESRFNEQFNLLLTEKADTMTRKLEQEQVEVIDAIARMQPPVLDFSIPASDWQGAAHDPDKMFFWIRNQNIVLFTSSAWPRNRQEQTDLRWIPFPSSLGLVDVRESVGDGEVLQHLLNGRRSTALPTSADYVRQIRTLKVLRPEDDDEELPMPWEEDQAQSSSPTPREDFMQLIRKRKQEQDAMDDPIDQESPTVGVKHRRTSTQSKPTKIHGLGLLLGENESNAAGKLLANYMDLRGAKRVKSPFDPLFPTTKRKASQAPAPIARQVPSKPKTTQPTTKKGPIDAPIPAIGHTNGPSRIIISTTLPREIISALQAKLPDIDLVDRDFSRHNTRVWSPGSVKTVEKPSTLSYEADIIPSPTTGIIITSILKVRQRPLPGSKTQFSQLRDRVARVAPLYEQLLILVSEGNPTAEHIGPLNAADAAVYTSFVAFACSVSNSSGCTIDVVYVAGGQKTLAHWTCALVSTHLKEASHQVQQVIMSEETEWEVFLRHAGFNMYAAQVALAVVKGGHPVADVNGDGGGNNHQDRTLVRFLRMSSSERASALKGFLGGGSLVDRVNARLG